MDEWLGPIPGSYLDFRKCNHAFLNNITHTKWHDKDGVVITNVDDEQQHLILCLKHLKSSNNQKCTKALPEHVNLKSFLLYSVPTYTKITSRYNSDNTRTHR